MTDLGASIVIIGLGPTGIGAALRLQELGHKDFLVIDRAPQAGGLAGSVVDPQGFTWDYGGHVQFSHYEKFDQAMELALGTDGFFQHQRESWVYMKDRFVPYPFQYNLHRLPKSDQQMALAGLQAIQGQPQNKTNFDTFLRSSFGDGLCDIFLTPYNFKVWAHPAELMSCQWTAERVAPVSLEKVQTNIEEQKDQVSWGPNNTFQFPKFGGTGAIWRSLADKISTNKMLLGSSVQSICAEEKIITLSDGRTVAYDQLVSSMPLNQLAAVLGDKELMEQTSQLLFSATHIFGVGLQGQPPEHLKTKCWMYFPESDCPFYRVTVFSNYSPNNTPRPGETWSLMAEVSESVHKTINPDTLFQEVIQGMKNTKLIQEGDGILSEFHLRLPQGYPVPGLQRDAVLGQVLPTLKDMDIYSRGRFGAWKYEVSNQDHSFMQGVEVVEHLLHGREEITLHRPDDVNKQHNPFPYPDWKA
ncbi:MAG: amine oxidase [Myxococcales bacterium]|nr:amine oxidase [Myxococcales bacterium]